ncbi:MAG: glycosyltransferase family 4 protein [Euryarchaeota archaeon]|nr:glycosyltransferase family 4 protein [Euryarchaeota archaeon]
MRVLYFIAVTPPGRLYGAERHHFVLAKSVKQLREEINVEIVSYNAERVEDIWRKPLSRGYFSTELEKIKIHKIPFNNLFVWLSNPLSLASQRILLLISEGEMFNGLKRGLLVLSEYYLTKTGWVPWNIIRRIMEESNPNIVHAYGIHLFNMAYKITSLAIENNLSKLVIWTIYHHYIPYERLLFSRPKILNILSRSSALISSTHKEAEIVKRLLIEHGLKVPSQYIIPPPVDLRSFTNPPKEDIEKLREVFGNPEYIILTMTLSEKKGVPSVVKALTDLKVNEKIALVSFGRANQQEVKAFETMKKELPPNISAYYLGFVDDRVKSALYALADVFVLPSEIDTFGLSYVEAWYYGTPVIGARNPYMEEVIGNMTRGLLVNPTNYDDIRRAILTLLEDRNLSKKLAENGRSFVLNELDANIVAKKIIDVYEETLS